MELIDSVNFNPSLVMMREYLFHHYSLDECQPLLLLHYAALEYSNLLVLFARLLDSLEHLVKFCVHLFVTILCLPFYFDTQTALISDICLTYFGMTHLCTIFAYFLFVSLLICNKSKQLQCIVP